MKKLAFLVLSLAIFSLRAPCAYSLDLYSFQHVVVFGDSLSDNGNSLVAVGKPQPPYGTFTYNGETYSYPGRWTNGPNWVDYFSGFSWINQHFLPISAFLQNRASGTNFALAGAPSPLLAVEIGTYLTATGGRASAKDLYIIWIGGDDFRREISAQILVSDIEAGIVLLWKAGARNFILINVPDISLEPETKAEGGATVQAAKQFVYTANSALQAQIPFYELFLRIKVVLVDVNAPFTTLINTGSVTLNGLGTFHFSNTSGYAFPNTDYLVSNSYVFWDSVHPTTLVHYLAAWLIFNSAFPGFSPVPIAK
jgi:phospholipase/lecithinase/hemolysin